MKTTLQRPRSAELKAALAGLVVEQRALAREKGPAPEQISSNEDYAVLTADLKTKEAAATRTVGSGGPAGVVGQEMVDAYIGSVNELRDVVGDPLVAALMREAMNEPGVIPDGTVQSLVALMRSGGIGAAEVNVLAALRPRMSETAVPTYVAALREAGVDDANNELKAKIIVGVGNSAPVVTATSSVVLPFVVSLGATIGSGGAAALLMTANILGKSAAEYSSRTQKNAREALGVNRLEGVDVTHELGRLREHVQNWSLPPSAQQAKALLDDVALVRTTIDRREKAGLIGAVAGSDAHTRLQQLADQVEKASSTATSSPTSAKGPDAWTAVKSARSQFLNDFSTEQLRTLPPMPRADANGEIFAPAALTQAHTLLALSTEKPDAYRALSACLAKEGKIAGADLQMLKLTFGNELSVREYCGLMILQERGQLDVASVWPDAARFGKAKNLAEALTNLDEKLGLSGKEAAGKHLKRQGDLAVLAVAVGLAFAMPIVGVGTLIAGIVGKQYATSQLAKQVEKAYFTDGVDVLNNPNTPMCEQELLLGRLLNGPPPWQQAGNVRSAIAEEAALIQTMLKSAVAVDPEGKHPALVGLSENLWICSEKLAAAGSLKNDFAARQAAAKALDELANPNTGNAMLLLAAEDEFREGRNGAVTALYVQTHALASALELPAGEGRDAAVRKAADEMLKVHAELSGHEDGRVQKTVKKSFPEVWLQLAQSFATPNKGEEKTERTPPKALQHFNLTGQVRAPMTPAQLNAAADDIKGAVGFWGTDEKKILGTLSAATPSGRKQIEATFAARHNQPLREFLAQSLFEGFEPARAILDATTLREAVLKSYDAHSGVTDESTGEAANRVVQLLWTKAHAAMGLKHDDADIELVLKTTQTRQPSLATDELRDPTRVSFDITGSVDIPRRSFQFRKDNPESGLKIRIRGDGMPDFTDGAEIKLGKGVLASVAAEVALARSEREHGSKAELTTVTPSVASVDKAVLERYGLTKAQVHGFTVETSRGRSTVLLTDEGFPIPAGA